jgi:chromosome segregation and condensation protein ScpB
MTDITLPETELSLLGLIEALLFVAPDAVAPAQLSTVLDLPLNEVENAWAVNAGCA